jgi:trimethylamine---corrinoid protein Co-methyltransferase
VKRNLFAGRPRSGGLSVNVFTESELEEIHFATLEVLERAGVFVEDDEALDIYSDGGCMVDRDTHIVRFPPHVVEDAIRSAPSRYVLYGRNNPKNDFVMEPGRVAFTNFSEGIRVIDVETGEYRNSTKKDIADIARLNDYLSEIDTHETAVGASDVPPETAAVHHTEVQLLNTTKPIGIGPLSRVEARAIFEMAAEVVGGADELRRRPILYGGVCPVSPLKLPRDATQVIIETSRWWIPNNILSMAMAGGSSPVTLAGTLVTHNAEVLSGITLAQLTERGCPVMYGSSTTAMDLKLAAACVGSPELAMISAAVAQMARRYLLPSFVAGL